MYRRCAEKGGGPGPKKRAPLPARLPLARFIFLCPCARGLAWRRSERANRRSRPIASRCRSRSLPRPLGSRAPRLRCRCPHSRFCSALRGGFGRFLVQLTATTSPLRRRRRGRSSRPCRAVRCQSATASLCAACPAATACAARAAAAPSTAARTARARIGRGPKTQARRSHRTPAGWQPRPLEINAPGRLSPQVRADQVSGFFGQHDDGRVGVA